MTFKNKYFIDDFIKNNSASKVCVQQKLSITTQAKLSFSLDPQSLYLNWRVSLWHISLD